MKLILLLTLITLTNNIFAKRSYSCFAESLVNSPSINKIILNLPESEFNTNYYKAKVSVYYQGKTTPDIIKDDGHFFYQFKKSYLQLNYEGATYADLYTNDNEKNYTGKMIIDEDFSYFIECKLEEIVIDQESDNKFIKDIAELAGMYVDLDEIYEHVEEVEYKTTPKIIKDAIKKHIRREMILMKKENPNNSITVSDEYNYEIIKDGRVIGYIIRLDDFIDILSWDGSGSSLYLNNLGRIIHIEYWSA